MDTWALEIAFLAVLRLDLFNQNPAADRQAIISGDLFSRAGDVLVDALLFDENIRNDISTFQLLYGFTPQMVMKKLSMFFWALELGYIICYDWDAYEKTITGDQWRHGTAIANSQFHLGKAGTDIHLEENRQTPLGRLHQVFLEFVSAVEEGGIQKWLSQRPLYSTY